ncbi:MFS transporter [Paenibacillus medicaginis]|uniref:MFS transporter n=1 Tax=Paenibacillus medicaginis TaxID=1470560 RepID=A0ABV5C395_9BACL
MYRSAIYLLALAVFLTATSELVISGILSIVANDMGISLAAAGQLITFYSLSFAIGTPVVISLTSRIGRKKLLFSAMVAFTAGCALSAISVSAAMLMVSRIILGASSGVFLVTAFGIAAKLVPAEKLGSALGTIILGFSTAMILGVPAGITITEWLNWKSIFVLLGLLGIVIGIVLFRLLPEMEGDEPAPFFQQFKWLGSSAVIIGLLITLFREGGNSVMMTYLTPYLQELYHLQTSELGLVMLGLGVIGAIGSRIGGYGVDRWGPAVVIGYALLTHAAAFMLLPLSGHVPGFGFILIAFAILAMFAAGPAMQSYFIQKAPHSANFILSINTSVIHLGLAAGAGIGGIAVNRVATLAYHPWISGVLLLLGLSAWTCGAVLGRKRAETVQ